MSKVSVLIPTYNRRQYLVEAIRSVQSQTYGDGCRMEIVVADDGSTDDTRSAVEAFGDAVRYLHQENQGVSAARNLAFRESTGEYVVFLDSDDTLLPNALADLSEALDSHPACDVAYSDGYIIDSNGLRRGTLSDYAPRPFVDALETFVAGDPLGLHGTMFRRSALESIEGPFDPQMLGYEDVDMIMRLKASGCTFQFFPLYTACYRFHGGNKSAPKSSLSEKRRLSLIRSRRKMMDAPWFAGLPLPARSAFFERFLAGPLPGDRTRQDEVTSHPAFQSLPDKTRAALLYRLTVDNILCHGVAPADRRTLTTAIGLDPINLRAYTLLALTLVGRNFPKRVLSRWRSVHAGVEASDPVSRILRAKSVA